MERMTQRRPYGLKKLLDFLLIQYSKQGEMQRKDNNL